MSPAAQRTSPAFDLAAYQQLDPPTLARRIGEVRRRLGRDLLILGHHYQQDEVLAQSDLQGDSYQLSARAAANQECRFIVFCGVHFMAETADILANRPEQFQRRGGRRASVILPDLTAGCSMADMAEIDQVEDCWEQLSGLLDIQDVMPVTYVNSAASLKAFCGRRGGIVCTSANARAVLEWSFQRRRRVLFFPDQHLGRNTARRMGIALDEMPLWDPGDCPDFRSTKMGLEEKGDSPPLCEAPGGPFRQMGTVPFFQPHLGGNSPETIRRSRVLLWNGHCSVHQVFLPQHVAQFRAKYPDIRILVHPECMMEVVDLADEIGSTGGIIRAVEQAPPGTRWAIGTELHLVERLKQRHPEQHIHFLAPVACICSTMYRIDLPHLCWALENLAAGTPVNVIRVDAETAAGALVALERMLEVK